MSATSHQKAKATRTHGDVGGGENYLTLRWQNEREDPAVVLLKEQVAQVAWEVACGQKCARRPGPGRLQPIMEPVCSRSG